MDATSIAEKFLIAGKITTIVPWGDGHINRTFRVTTTARDYVLQQINTTVFRDVTALIRNIDLVTGYLTDAGHETLELIPTLDGGLYYEDEAHGCYRMYVFINNTVSYSLVDSAETLESTAEAFGEFQNQLAGFDASLLAETIPLFHHTPNRYVLFDAAVDADRIGRVAGVSEEIGFFEERRAEASVVTDCLADGSIPVRVTHNDTKINNILIDADTGTARAIIDLDTVMPGSLLYDFGDALRTGGAVAAEDEQDVALVGFSLELFEAYCRGFIRALRDSITPRELELLPDSVRLMTLECGLRFLTDYLDGDNYFGIAYPEHNLVRARNQMALVRDLEEKMSRMREIVREVSGEFGLNY
ncbi:Phosphotransferase enzyme family [Arcanobacterium haemolyticum]|uniref:Aminoglycoside phosphotransferase n=2 Tax=Arcanobacterium haemolyticum TaxID=28264 RepID=D7BLI1_ARCHD|nr:aminoglycoside phosphotransferase [Arcanobacterium haemolyticum DSM 20595]SQH27422.1 Phosphotransferase enzyme family [Arcanobacterium haemolyticum]